MREKKTRRRSSCWYFAVLLFLMQAHSFALNEDQTFENDFTTLRQHFLNEIYESVPKEERAFWGVESIQYFESQQTADGTFHDIDYSVHGQAGYWPLDQLGRALLMVRATLYPENRFYQNQDLIRRARLAVHYWAKNIPGPHYNWWSNEIGLPLSSAKLLFLLPDSLPAEDREALIQVTEKGHLTDHPSHFPATGENLIWFSEITLALGVLEKKTDWIQLASDAIKEEIQSGNAEGIQSDGSFFQHGEVFYNGGYGLNYATDSATVLQLLSETSYALSDENYQSLSKYILDAELWLVHEHSIELSSLGRTYTRTGANDSLLLLTPCKIMAEVKGPRQAEFMDCVKQLSQQNYPGKIGNKSFWKSDFMTDNHPEYSISVKMHSNRTYNNDASPMGEGLKSEFLSDGVTYFYQTGLEYKDIYPIWDFFRIPGTTEEHQDVYPEVPGNNFHNTYGPSSFVGGLSDGSVGFTTMEFVRDDLSVNKSWFFHQGGMLALGGALECDTCKNQILTSINQEWSKTAVQYGPIETGSSEPRESILGETPARLSRGHWVYANQKGYLVFGNHPMVIQESEQQGSWHALAAALPETPVKGKVFSLWIEQDAHPRSDDYVYAVYPGIQADALKKLALAPDFEILENDYYRQGVYFPKEFLIQAVYHWAGTLTWDQGLSRLSSSMPCVAQLKKIGSEIELSVASPNEKTRSTVIEWNWLGKKGSRVIHFPEGDQAGSTVSFRI